MEKCRAVWKKICSWKYWHKLLFPNGFWVLVLAAVSGAGLVWVFTNGKELTVGAYLLYGISAYALTVLCLLLWKRLPWLKYHFQRDPLARKLLKEDSAFGIGLYAEQILNFCYGGFKILWGAVVGSAWIGADGIYNFLQGCIQLYQILQHKKVTELKKQWKSYRACGWLVMGLHLTMTGMMFQMIQLGRHESATEISIIATAAFTFYKLVSAVIAVAKDRKHENPLDSSVFFLDFAQALYNLFVLQVGLLWVFGGADYPYQKLMNTLTGTAVCLLVLGLGINMVRRANKNLKNEKSTA